MSRTAQNLAKAFIGESQASTRYTMYSAVARDEGYEQIAEIFQQTADQEKEHAKHLYTYIAGLKAKGDFETLEVEAEVPVTYGSTAENLRAAIAGENFEHTTMYPEYAAVADSEGYRDIAVRMRNIAKAEMHHEERYMKLLDVVESGSFFKKEEKTWWVCRQCGFMHYGTEPPARCPACDRPRALYQRKCEEY
ncbi:MAG: rubrerythrin family protein [Methanomassiliicoccus sp.]|nr:rubrerythrin family protein [Methanomassiliicoccus sp.]